MDLLTYWFLAFILFNLIYGLGTWNLYKKAGRKAWEAFVPFYNTFIGLTKIIGRPWWWMILFFVPIVMPIFWIVYWVDFGRSFSKRSLVDGILMAVTLGLYSYYLNYIEKPDYEGAEDRKSTLLSSLIFAIVLATLVHNWFVQPMVVPTGSMENTIKIGDALFVEKISYGARVPLTPIGIPYSEFINRNAFINTIRLPYLRLPGWRKIQANDIVVFNYPTDSLYTAIDRKDAYVKRLVGMPGDSLQVRNGVLYINGKKFIPKKDAKVQHAYKVMTKVPFTEKALYDEFEIISKDYAAIPQDSVGNYTYYFNALTDDFVTKMKQNPQVISVDPALMEPGKKVERMITKNGKEVMDSTNTIFPVNKNWNPDQYGTLYIPKKGDVVTLNHETLPQYINLIHRYEHHKIEEKSGKIYVDNQPTDKYTVQQDYFFMMGDNRNESLDSRFFGYVPEDHIIGRPIMIWANFNGLFEPAPKKFIWNRWFTSINNDNPDKTSYRWYVLALVVVFFGWDYYQNKKKKEAGKASYERKKSKK